MKKPAALFVFAALGAALATQGAAKAGDSRAGWEFSADLPVERRGLMEVRVASEVLDRSLAGLDDLRVLDPRGVEVPWVLGRGWLSAVTRSPADPHWSVTPIATTVSFGTAGMREALPLSRISVETNAREFLKSATVEASDDAVAWRALAADQPLFRSQGVSRLDIDFPSSSARWFRVRLDDSRFPPIPVIGLRVHRLPAAGEPRETISVTPKSVEAVTGGTRIVVDLPGANLPLEGVTLEVRDPLFRRRVDVLDRNVRDGEVTEQTIGSGVVCRIEVQGGQASSPTIQISTVPRGRQLVLRIDDADSSPLTVTGIRLHIAPTNLRFMAAEPGRHRIVFGSPGAPRPRYDIRELEERLLELPAARVEHGPVSRNPGYALPEVLPGLPATGRRLETDQWRHRRSVQISGAGVHQIELPAEVFARAGARLEDLRLAAGGFQIPYLLDRFGAERALTPTVQGIAPDEGSRASRTAVRLPFDGLPLTRITCRVGAAVFARRVAVYEEQPGQQGRVGKAYLAMATWERKGEGEPDTFTLPLKREPRSGTLVLEIDDGDNLPLPLSDIRVFYRSARLIFKGGQTGGLELLYGNPEAAAPRYDIGLVAAELLAAEKAPATLGPEAGLSFGRWWHGSGSAEGGWLVWGALALVTAALVAIIFKLLPQR